MQVLQQDIRTYGNGMGLSSIITGVDRTFGACNYYNRTSGLTVMGRVCQILKPVLIELSEQESITTGHLASR